MSLNTEQTFSLDLSLFSGKVNGIAAANLPPGSSPDCTDVFFLPQQVATRPAFIYALDDTLGSKDIMSHAPYSSPNGLKYIISAASDGSLNSYDVKAGMNAPLGTCEAGARFASTEAFAKFFMAFYDSAEAANFSNSQFVGTDIPRYVNQFGVLSRVTVDGPGGGWGTSDVLEGTLTVSSLSRSGNIVTADLITSPANLEVGWFVNPVDNQGTPGSVPGGGGIGPINSIDQAWTLGNSTIRQAASPTNPGAGNYYIVYYNRSDLPGIQDYDLCNAVASGETYVTMTNIAQYGLVDGTYLCTQADATNVIPPGGSHHWYFFVLQVPGPAQAIGSDSNVAFGTTATYQRGFPLTNAANELFQSLGNVSLTGDGTGNIHVTCSGYASITNLPVGAWLYLFIQPQTAASISFWSLDIINGTATIVVPNTNWSIGTQVVLNGFQANSTNTQPTYWNGQTVTITGTSGDAYTFPWGSGTSSNGLIGAAGGTAAPTQTAYPSQWVQVTQVISPTQFTYFAVGNTQTATIAGTLYDYFGSLNTQLSLVPPLPNQTSVSNSSAENVAQGFQILSIAGNVITWYQSGPDDVYDGNHILTLVPQTAVAPGPRSAFVFFISQDGAASPGGPPQYFSTKGGSFYPEFINLPLGPPGTIARGIAITPAYGADYFVLPSAQQRTATGVIITPGTIIQNNTQMSVVLDWSDAALVAAIPASGTEALGSDFGDLTSTINLPPCLGVLAYDQSLLWWGEINNIKNLLNMSMQGGAVTLSGVTPSGIPPGWNATTEYNGITPDGSGTLALALDGSGWAYELGDAYSTATGVYLGTTVESNLQVSMGSEIHDQYWGISDTLWGPAYKASFTFRFGNGTSTSNVGPFPSSGITISWLGKYNNDTPISSFNVTQAQCEAGYIPAVLIPAGAYHAKISAISATYNISCDMSLYAPIAGNSMISQPAYQDIWGRPITLPGKTYIARYRAQLISGTANGSMVFALYSPTMGILATATTAVSAFSGTTLSWVDQAFSAALPTATAGGIPTDTVLYVTLSGNGSPQQVAIADLSLIDQAQPVLQNQARISYPDNEFGYDNENGYVIGLSTSDAIVSAFAQRSLLYFNTENDLFSTQSTNNSVPSEWPTALVAQECGGSGPNATASLQDIAWWVGRQGVQVFNGTEPKKISQEVQPDFDRTNWNAIVNTAMEHDAIQRVLYIAIPTGSNVNPSQIQSMNHRMADPAVNIMDPVHISSYTGKMIATDLARKWTPAAVSFNSLKNCYVKTGSIVALEMTFGSGGGGDYGMVYYQDFTNYPPTNPAASSWNSVDTDFGQIISYYQGYYQYSHDVEQNALLALYRKLFCYMSFHAIGTGHIKVTPYIDAQSNPWPIVGTWALSLTDPGFDFESPMNATGNRMSIKYSCTDGAFQLSHQIVSARRDLVFPVRGAF